MKILIGTPVHISKDYCMERWLKNLKELDYPADLLLVDNSPGSEYVKKIQGYCDKFGIQNYQIFHLDLDQGTSIEEKDNRIERCQEVIRQEVLDKKYDAWFSWECDQIIPKHTLTKLIELLKGGNFMMVVHNSWARNNPDEYNPDMGVTLIAREGLEKVGFLPDKDLANWQGGERWFKERVFRAGGNYIDVYGLVNPIYHLDK